MLTCATVIVLIITYRCAALWSQGSTQLPEATDQLALGYDAATNTILMFGGYRSPRAFVKFKDDQFTAVATDYLSIDQQTMSMSQHYTQLLNELWILRADGEGFIQINTETYAVTDPLITIPISVGDGACLSSVPGFLIVIGGYGSNDAIDDVQIYNFEASQWLSSVPTLSTKRDATSCVAVSDKVYVIGGHDGSAYLDSIEALNVANLPNTSGLSWNTLSGKLASARHGTRAAVHGTDIFVVGGRADDDYLADVNVIDTISGNCEVEDTLAFKAAHASSIIVDDVLYSFGGYEVLSAKSLYLDKYQYTVLAALPATSSKNPTSNPSIGPTETITHDPTLLPSEYTSVAPTKSPTESATHDATLVSSGNPTVAPSKSSTEIPTIAPSNDPISNQTIPSTESDAADVTLFPIVSPTEEEAQGESESKQFNEWWVINIVAAITTLICFIISVILCRCHCKRKREARSVKDIDVIEIETRTKDNALSAPYVEENNGKKIKGSIAVVECKDADNAVDNISSSEESSHGLYVNRDPNANVVTVDTSTACSVNNEGVVITAGAGFEGVNDNDANVKRNGTARQTKSETTRETKHGKARQTNNGTAGFTRRVV